MKLLKKELTRDDLDKLREAHRAVKGTGNYSRYLMENDAQMTTDSGRKYWTFIGWFLPYSLDEAIIKKYGDNVYIISIDCYDGSLERYRVTEEVNELLNIYAE